MPRLRGPCPETQSLQPLSSPARSHWGYFQMRLCPLSSASTASEKAQLSEACLDDNILELSGGPAIDGTKYWIYTGNQGDQFVINTNAKLPRGVSCDRCVLQVCVARVSFVMSQILN